MNGINFGMDGLVLDNTTWYNAKTGDTFKVKSNYFENNRMVIQAYDGRTFDLDHLNDYVQWTGKDAPPKPQPKQQKHNDDIPQNIKDMIAGSDDDILPEDLDILYPTANTHKPQTKQESPNQLIIDRALSKVTKPTIKTEITWKKFPQREIDMLVNVMDIPMSEIVDYYINSLSLDDLLESIKDQIPVYINSNTETTKKSKK